jgi:hypothetical protein
MYYKFSGHLLKHEARRDIQSYNTKGILRANIKNVSAMAVWQPTSVKVWL